MSTVVPVNQSTAPAVSVKKPQTVRQLIEGPEFSAALAKSLPKHLKPERFIRVAITAMLRVPKLAQCDQASFLQALLQLSQYGLEPDGRRAHLIPYKNNKLSTARGHDVYDCQLVVDYKGLAELVLRSGLVSYLHADVVRRGDIFSFSKGELKDHVSWFLRTDADKPAEAGPVFAVYAMAKLKDGTEKVEVMSVEQCEAIRKRSRAGNDGPWVTDREEMQKKTVFRRLTKWLPLSSEVREAAENDDDVIDVSTAPSAGSIGGGLSEALMAPADDSESVDDSGGSEVPEPEAGALPDREALIAIMKESILDSGGKLTEKKVFEFAKRSLLVPEGIDEIWALPTASLVKVNGSLVELAKGGAK